MEQQKIYDHVLQHYSAASRKQDSEYGVKVAKAFGYSQEDLDAAAEDSNLGLSCGNPLAIASLRENEFVIDLGSGAGFDAFQAVRKVGRRGRVLGVDMNKDMVERANGIKDRLGHENVLFVQSLITRIDLADNSADCIISNCVVNLVPEREKQLVFDEAFRLLKPGGRLAMSDILAKRPLPEVLRQDMALYVGCISGASQVWQYEEYLRRAGFNEFLISDSHSDLNAYGAAAVGCCGPTPEPRSSFCGGDSGDTAATTCGPQRQAPLSVRQRQTEYGDLNDWAGSYKIFAVKPI